MDVKYLLILLICVQLVQSFSWTPDKKDPDEYLDLEPETTTKKLPSKCANKSKGLNNPISTTPPTAKLGCKNLVAYYEGTFISNYTSKDSSPSQKMQFQINIWLNETDNKIYGKITNWNETLWPSSPVTWWIGGEKSNYKINETAVTSTGYIGVYIGTFHILDMDYVDRSLQMEEVVGQCSRMNSKHDCDLRPQIEQYKHCICCGDHYDPTPELSCPESPWAKPANDC